MSKATFYEHFANKEECILALLRLGAGLACSRAMVERDARGGQRLRARACAPGSMPCSS